MVNTTSKALNLIRVGALLLAPTSTRVVQSFQPSLISSNRVQQHHTSAHTSHPSRLIYTQLCVSSSSESHPAKTRARRPRNNNKRKPQKEPKNPNEIVTWRVYGVDVNPDALGAVSTTDKRKENESAPPERMYLAPPVLSSLLSRLRIKGIPIEEGQVADSPETITLPPELKDARVIRRSIDARRRRGAEPKYTYVVDVDVTKGKARELRFVHQPGRMELVNDKQLQDKKASSENEVFFDIRKVTDGSSEDSDSTPSKTKPKIIIVGAGPAGLFCALSLASSGFTPILLERGQPVEARGKSIGALIHRRSIDPESNFSFGEGGAGNLYIALSLQLIFCGL